MQWAHHGWCVGGWEQDVCDVASAVGQRSSLLLRAVHRVLLVIEAQLGDVALGLREAVGVHATQEPVPRQHK